MLVAYASAGCNVLKRMKVKTQWAQAFSEGVDRETFGQAVWRAIFAQAPEARALFKRVGGNNVLSPEFQAHSMRVMGGLDMCISLLDDQPALDAQTAHLKAQHIERKIPGNYFTVFGRALMQAIPASIGRCFDEAAWEACYDGLASRIKH